MINEEKTPYNMTASTDNNSPLNRVSVQKLTTAAEVYQQFAKYNSEFGNKQKNMCISKSVNGYRINAFAQLSLQTEPSSKSRIPTDWDSMTDNEREILQRERRKQSSYKTALCQAFKKSWSCTYGVMCRFAHGDIELRLPPAAHPKYKTQLCNKFALKGSCPYGARCQFIHQKPNEQLMWGDLDSISPIPQFALPAYQSGISQPASIAGNAYNFGNVKAECDQILLSPARRPDFGNSYDSSGQRSLITSSGDYANCERPFVANQPQVVNSRYPANQFVTNSNGFNYNDMNGAHDNTLNTPYKTPPETYNERYYRLFSQSCAPNLH